MRQEDRVEGCLATMAEEQAQQFLRAWRLVKPVQAVQRARGGFETLSFRVGQTQPLAQALGVFGWSDAERGKTQERILQRTCADRHDAPQPRRIRR